MVNIPESQKLSAIIAELQNDIKKIKAGTSSGQLQNSSIEVNTGRGFIPILENGQEKLRIGRQPDGTITTVSKNNTDPPATPNDPVCTPFIGGVTVTCTGFQSRQFLDFSHIRVYVDGALSETIMKVPGSVTVAPLTPEPHTFFFRSVNLSNTASPASQVVIATPNLVVGSDITDGIIDEVKLANDAVTEAKIAAEAVTGSKIIAEAIQSLHVAAEAISADKIAANSVTAEKIQALAITANKIAANAVEAGHIKAGAVTAEKLAAQIILATTALIIGNPIGAKLVLDSTGITQSDAAGNIALQIGNTPGSNSYTVIDSTDPSNALASIGPDGAMSMNGISINGTATLNGIDLVNYLNSLPQGIIARGTYQGEYSPGSNNEIGMFELSFNAIAGRSYKVSTDSFGVYGRTGILNVRYTTNGSIPTVTSSYLTSSQASGGEYQFLTGDTGGHSHYVTNPETSNSINTFFHATSNQTVRMLLTVELPGGNQGPVYIDTYGPNDTLTLIVEDLGTTPNSLGGSNAGAGSTSAIGQTTRTYNPTYTKYTRDGTPAAGLVNGLQIGKAGDYNYFSLLGFDHTTIVSNLSGATINKVELYLYSNYWSINEGGYVSIGTHNISGISPSSYSFVTRNLGVQKMKKPQGLWITLPNSIGDAFKANTIKGLVLDCRTNYPDSTNFGIFRDIFYTDATTRPVLRITYTK